jgi:flavin-dependent dehydrogenase
MLGSRVAGIRTARGDFYADLVIDACGLSSPVRSALPDFTLTDREAGKNNTLTAYRAYFDRVPGSEEPAQKYKVYLLPGENAGLMWTIVHPDCVDVLIGAFAGLTAEDIEEKLAYLRSVNPQLGETLKKGGACHRIPVRQPMAVLVADGYAAVGDAAFMTIPVKGSGVGYAMRAGKILAECVIRDEKGLYNRETLWKYQCEFFEKIGFDGAMLAIVKNLFPLITLDDIDYVIGAGRLSPETLQKFGNEESMVKILTSMKFSEARDLTRKIAGHQNLRKMILTTAKNIARYTMLRQTLKNRYESRSVEKWANAYNKFYASIAAGQTDEDEAEPPFPEEPAEE